MSVIYVVLPLALVIAAGMVWAFMRSVRRGQFDDLETPAMRMLFDDPPQRVAPSRQCKSEPPDPLLADAAGLGDQPTASAEPTAPTTPGSPVGQ